MHKNPNLDFCCCWIASIAEQMMTQHKAGWVLQMQNQFSWNLKLVDMVNCWIHTTFPLISNRKVNVERKKVKVKIPTTSIFRWLPQRQEDLRRWRRWTRTRTRTWGRCSVRSWGTPSASWRCGRWWLCWYFVGNLIDVVIRWFERSMWFFSFQLCKNCQKFLLSWPFLLF